MVFRITEWLSMRADGAGHTRVPLREALAQRAPLLGTFVMLPRVEVLELLALADYDVAVLDMEHAPITIDDLPSLVAAGRGAGMYVMARVAHLDDLPQVLDTGVDGALVPHISDRTAAQAVADAGRFPPTGSRSINPYVRGLGYGAAAHNPAPMLVRQPALLAMVEGADAIPHLDEIAGVEEIDGIFVGPVDLAGSLGYPGQPEHPAVIDTIERTIAGAVARGSCVALYAPTSDAASRWFDASATLVVVSADLAMIQDGFRAIRTATKLTGRNEVPHG